MTTNNILSDEIEKLYYDGMTCDQENDKYGAIQCFQKILSMPDIDKTLQYYRSSRHNLACKLLEIDLKDKRGLELLEESANDNHPFSLYYMGVVYERENDCRAISCYRKSAELECQQSIDALRDIFGEDFQAF